MAQSDDHVERLIALWQRSGTATNRSLYAPDFASITSTAASGNKRSPEPSADSPQESSPNHPPSTIPRFIGLTPLGLCLGRTHILGPSRPRHIRRILPPSPLLALRTSRHFLASRVPIVYTRHIVTATPISRVNAPPADLPRKPSPRAPAVRCASPCRPPPLAGPAAHRDLRAWPQPAPSRGVPTCHPRIARQPPKPRLKPPRRASRVFWKKLLLRTRGPFRAV